MKNFTVERICPDIVRVRVRRLKGCIQRVIDKVPWRRIISGMGERPAVVHLRDFELGAFVTLEASLEDRLRCFDPALLRQVVLAPDEVLRGSGDDLNAFF